MTRAGPEPPASVERGGALGWAGVAALALGAALAAVLGVLLVPVYAGTVLLPVGALLAIAGNIALPRLAFALVGTTLAAAVPFLVWLVVVVVFGVMTRPEGDVILPGGSAEWASYLMLLGGTLVGAGTVATAVPPRTQSPRNRPPGDQPVKGSRLPSRKAS